MLPIALLSTLATPAALRHASHGWHPKVPSTWPPCWKTVLQEQSWRKPHLAWKKSVDLKVVSYNFTAPRFSMLLLMDEIRLTSWYGKYPSIYRVLSPSQVVGLGISSTTQYVQHNSDSLRSSFPGFSGERSNQKGHLFHPWVFVGAKTSHVFFSSWWLNQPIWKMCARHVKLDQFPHVTVKIKNLWVVTA